MIRAGIFFAILLLVPLALIAGGTYGIVTGDISKRHIHMTGISARVISGVGILAGVAIFRAYWMVIRSDGFDVNDPIFLGCLILCAVALGAGLVLMFLSVAF